MRVIAGTYRGKRLNAPQDRNVRPTTDRIKETVFNVLCNRYGIGARVLDLFCGSGALGIEALSRGAVECVFVDRDIASVRLTRSNLIGIKEHTEVYTADYKVALSKLSQPFDLILIDPPYADTAAYDAIAMIDEKKLLGLDGVIFAEHSRENNFINFPASFIIDTRDCGNTRISFLTYPRECHEE